MMHGRFAVGRAAGLDGGAFADLPPMEHEQDGNLHAGARHHPPWRSMTDRGQNAHIYTIGHSTRTLVEFQRILGAYGIALLVDVRTLPRSRHVPQFNRDRLEAELPRAGIRYVHCKELGGLRQPAAESVNQGWSSPGFQGYADYMQTEAFSTAIDRLLRAGTREPTTVMCAEGDPYRCHRLLIADALVVRGASVTHISSAASARVHRLAPFARVDGLRITYPPGQSCLVERKDPRRTN